MVERPEANARPPVVAPADGAPTIFLHVGEPKTGTTFLQQVMFANRAGLLEHGVLVPGQRPLAHWRAAQDVRSVEQLPNDPLGSNAGAWERLANEAMTAPRAAVISHELFAAADQDDAERAVRSLAPAEVHVVLTVRDFGSLLPAEWQETVKHRNTEDWDDWLEAVVDVEAVDPDRRKFWFWKVHDTLEVLRVWSTLVPPEHVHLITMPQSRTDPDLLWRRFAEVIGVDPTAADTAAARSNASLGLAEVELLRRVNVALSDDVPGFAYMRNVKDLLAHGALAARPSSLGKLVLPAAREDWARTHAASVIEALRGSKYDIVGDLEELLPQQVSGDGAHPRDASAEQMLDSAVIAIGVLVERLADAQKPTRRRLAPARTPASEATESADQPAAGTDADETPEAESAPEDAAPESSAEEPAAQTPAEPATQTSAKPQRPEPASAPTPSPTGSKLRRAGRAAFDAWRTSDPKR